MEVNIFLSGDRENGKREREESEMVKDQEGLEID